MRHRRLCTLAVNCVFYSHTISCGLLSCCCACSISLQFHRRHHVEFFVVVVAVASMQQKNNVIYFFPPVWYAKPFHSNCAVFYIYVLLEMLVVVNDQPLLSRDYEQTLARCDTP